MGIEFSSSLVLGSRPTSFLVTLKLKMRFKVSSLITWGAFTEQKGYWSTGNYTTSVRKSSSQPYHFIKTPK